MLGSVKLHTTWCVYE